MLIFGLGHNVVNFDHFLLGFKCVIQSFRVYGVEVGGCKKYFSYGYIQNPFVHFRENMIRISDQINNKSTIVRITAA